MLLNRILASPIAHIACKYSSSLSISGCQCHRAAVSVDASLINCVRVFCSTSSDQSKISSTPAAKHERIKSKTVKNKPNRSKNDVKDLLTIKSYSTAEKYLLHEFYESISSKSSFKVIDVSEDLEDEVVVFQLNKTDEKVPSIIYVFREGSIVLWNVTGREEKDILDHLKAYEHKAYPPNFVEEEKETIDFAYIDGKSKIFKNEFHLSKSESPSLSQYTFSNALALSVKLAIWEVTLESYVESMRSVSQDISDGKSIRVTRNQVFRKTGQLFALRHYINLSSDLLDTPDFYWDRQELENLFLQTCSYLNLTKRTKVMNEKLNHCCELMDLISCHLNDKHHVRLEWMIIILIMVEIVFEAVHYMDRSFSDQVESK
ncbi:required for meiotic nuclear division protein 1 homolog [Brevipalpus obovatus]|uniref:required for meiotic nuclear division protein 1 homolog n=1 Tax=Brevipalpus obovatus TaxID=246614 RepID=UPI003D9DF8F1